MTAELSFTGKTENAYNARKIVRSATRTSATPVQITHFCTRISVSSPVPTTSTKKIKSAINALVIARNATQINA